jgi:CRISPR/Cas system Type II protein with McrA/HNH and RuvC-like nuclease domain
MAKILGLDLGTNSIGWALIEVNEQGEFLRLIDCGVRIFPKGVNVDQQNKESSKNKIRRDARRARRNNFRYKKRRQKLLRELSKIGIKPDSYFYTNERKSKRGFKKSDIWNHTLELFRLRKRALNEKVSLPELGRIFMHLNSHRGFKSNKKEEAFVENNEETKKEKGAVDKRINALKRRMQELNCDTLGEYYFYLIEQNQNSHNVNEPKIESTEDFTDAIRGEGAYTLREMFEHEFNRIWAKQKEFYPEVLTDENKEIIGDDCIFYQRKLRSVQHLRNRCTLEYKPITVYKFNKEKAKEQIVAIKFKASDEQDFQNFSAQEIDKLYVYLTKNKYRLTIGDLTSVLGLYKLVSKERRKKDKFRFIFQNLPKEKQIRKKYLPATPVSSFEYQDYRIWEQINRLRFTNSDSTFAELNAEQKQILANALAFKEKIPFKGKKEKTVSEILGFPKETEYNIDKDYLIGNKTQARLINALGKDFWEELSLKERKTLWHNIQYAEDKKWLKGDKNFIEKTQRANKRRNHIHQNNYSLKQEWLATITRLGLSKKQIEKYADVTFEPDYAPYSLKAINKLLERMKQGSDVTTASFEVYGKYASEIQDKSSILEYKVPQLPGNSLKNPIVERAVVEAIGIINAVIDEYDKPDKVRIEMGRELKMPKIAREERNLKNKNINTRREFYAKFLNDHVQIERNNYEASSPDIKKFEMFLELNYSQEAFERIKKNISAKEFRDFLGANIPKNKEKYLLWLECDRIDPYEGKTIGLAQLFTSEVEIEHIIPYSRSMDNSMVNKTLSFKKFNALKGDKIPLEYFDGDTRKLDEFKQRIKHFSDVKKERFLMKSEDLGGFLNSQRVNNAYIAKQIREHLLKAFRNNDIEMTNGQLTEIVRRTLALDQILNPAIRADGYNIRGKAWGIFNGNQAINFLERINDKSPQGYDDYKIVKGSVYNNNFYPVKNRNDHRHHTVDALVTALINLKIQKEITGCTEGYYLKNGKKYSVSEIEKMYQHFSDFKNDIEDESLKFISKFEEKNGRYVFSKEARNDINQVLIAKLGLNDSAQILNETKEEIRYVLVSHKNDKIDSQPRKKLYNSNGTPKMVAGKNGKYQVKSGGDYVRGNMFEANPYGQTNDCAPNEYVKRVPLAGITLAQISRIVDKAIKSIVIENISQFVQNIIDEENINLNGEVKKLILLKMEQADIKEQISNFKDSSDKQSVSRRKTLKLQMDDIKSSINDIVPNKETENDFKKAFDRGRKLAFSSGFYLKNEGKRKSKLGKPAGSIKRDDIPIKKVRIKYISNTMVPVKPEETPRNKKYMKPDGNYSMAVYGSVDSNNGERIFELLSWYKKARIDSENNKRKKDRLSKLDYYSKSKEGLPFLFEVKHNDAFLIFDDNPLEEIVFNNKQSLLNRLFIVNDFDTTGKIVLKRHHLILEKQATKEESALDYTSGEGKVFRCRAWNLNAVPVIFDSIGNIDIEYSKKFIEKHAK